MRKHIFFISVFLFIALILIKYTSAQTSGPTIGTITTQIQGDIEKYAKFEISFSITNTTATNPYFPYDPAPPSGVDGTGITVNMQLLPPGQSNWSNALVQPCFYFQPYEEVGTGNTAALLPVGSADWRCRFTPETVGNWQYRIEAVDSQGTSQSNSSQFTVVDSNRKGFIKVSQTDPRFFEFSNGEPFNTPLINIEEGNPLNGLSKLRTSLATLQNNGISFVRWLPTGEGANYYVIPFGDGIESSWTFGTNAWGAQTDIVDIGRHFSFSPYYYSSQTIPLKPNATYRMTVRAAVSGERVLRIQFGTSSLDICSTSNIEHPNCSVRVDGFTTQTITYTNGTTPSTTAALRGLYVNTDAPSPFNVNKPGTIRIAYATLERDETGSGGWGANLLTRSDADTYNYVDQIGAARMDEVLRVSEQYGIYHKMPLFEKNDNLLNLIQPDGTIGSWFNCGWGNCPNNFYSAPGQAVRFFRDAYTRYFVARWGYSPSIHSLELANETDLYAESYNAGWDFAQLVKSLSSRPILMSNSFWGYFANAFFADPVKGNLLDFGDQHLYGSVAGNGTTISTIWADSAAYVKECGTLFNSYKNNFSYNKPIIRGEGGITQSGTQPQHPDIALDSTGTYYHKKAWAHVGILGFTCDGEWYPRNFIGGAAYPNLSYYQAYNNFITGEPVNNGNYVEIGTELTGNEQILVSNQVGNIRAFGSKDTVNGNALLWIDNADQTWKNVVDGVAISDAGGTLTLQNMPQGSYSASWWDTQTGAVTTPPPSTQTNYSVDATQQLTLDISNLSSDIAVKFTNTSITSTPTPGQIPGDADNNGQVTITDFIIWKDDFTNSTSLSSDFDGDGNVTILDFIVWKNAFINS